MRKEGNLIIWDLAQRKGDTLQLGKDLLDHMQNLFGLGEEERLRFFRAEHKQDEEPNLWGQHLSLLDKYVLAIMCNAQEVVVKLDDKGWERLQELSKELEALNRKMIK